MDKEKIRNIAGFVGLTLVILGSILHANTTMIAIGIALVGYGFLTKIERFFEKVSEHRTP